MDNNIDEQARDIYIQLAHEAKVVMETYLDDMAAVDPTALATKGMKTAYDWLVRYEMCEIREATNEDG